MATKKVTKTQTKKSDDIQTSWNFVKNAVYKGQQNGLFTLRDSAVLLNAIGILDAELLDQETE
jgi:hypothetical protein